MTGLTTSARKSYRLSSQLIPLMPRVLLHCSMNACFDFTYSHFYKGKVITAFLALSTSQVHELSILSTQELSSLPFLSSPAAVFMSCTTY